MAVPLFVVGSANICSIHKRGGQLEGSIMNGLSHISWKTCLALAGFLLAAPPLSAAPAAQAGERHLEGTVVDQQALPIPGAQIVVTQQQGSVRKTAVSSTSRFRIDGLVPGVYDVRI